MTYQSVISGTNNHSRFSLMIHSPQRKALNVISKLCLCQQRRQHDDVELEQKHQKLSDDRDP
jgi:hypothetical protein